MSDARLNEGLLKRLAAAFRLIFNPRRANEMRECMERLEVQISVLERQIRALEHALHEMHARPGEPEPAESGEAKTDTQGGGREGGSGFVPRQIVRLVEELRRDAEPLLSRQPAAATGASSGPRVAVGGLDIELRGVFSVEDGKAAISTFPPGSASPEAASTIRFTLRPEQRIEIAEDDRSEVPD